MRMATMGDSRKCLFLALALVLCTRLSFTLSVWKTSGAPGFFGVDTPQYIKPAESLLHGSFSSSGDFAPAKAAEIFRTPGYPLLLVPAAALHHIVIIGIAENLLLALVSAWLVWRIADDLFPASNAPFWATLFYCFEPVGLMCTNTVMSDTAFATAFLLFVWLFVCYLRRPAYTRLALAAAILGFATYIRPVTLYLSLLLGVMLVFWPRRLNWRQRVGTAVLFPLLFLLILVPWKIRNAVVADYKGFTSTQDWNLYFVTASAVQAKVEGRSVSAAVHAGLETTPERYLSAHPEQRSWTEGEKIRYWGREARKMIESHLGAFAQVYARNCTALVINPGVSEVLLQTGLSPGNRALLAANLDRGFLAGPMWLIRQRPIIAIVVLVMMLQLLVYYLLALASLRSLAPEIRIFFIMLYLYFVLVSGFITAGTRLRAPIMPVVCIAAGIAIANWGRTARLKSAADSRK
jgi:4-amino-4-deoxy-L-arabinose transferase-like glycosyltransferase